MAYWSLLFFIVGGVFRRILGKTFKIKGIKIGRAYKLIVLALLCVLMYAIKGVFPKTLVEWFCMAWAIGWLIRYNSHTHGDYYILDETKPDEERSPWVGKVLKFLFGKGKYYDFAGNFVGLTLGYLVPAALASITMNHHWFWLAGFTSPLGYAICEFTLKFTGHRTAFAECLNGAVMLLLFFLNV